MFEIKRLLRVHARFASGHSLTAVMRSGCLEPRLAANHVSLFEVFVGLGQVDDEFDEGDQADDHRWHAQQNEAEQEHQQHDDALSVVAQVELVRAKGTQEKRQQRRRNFFELPEVAGPSWKIASTLLPLVEKSTRLPAFGSTALFQ